MKKNKKEGQIKTITFLGKINNILNNVMTYVVIILFFIVLLKLGLPIATYSISGESMYPTYEDGEKIKINKLNTLKKIITKTDYQRGDVVLLYEKYLFNDILIKRIVAVPGDTVSIKDGYLYVNGEKEADNYPQMIYAGILDNKEITLGKNEYFYLGDNRNYSTDSRYFGTTKKILLIGKIEEQRPYDSDSINNL